MDPVCIFCQKLDRLGINTLSSSSYLTHSSIFAQGWKLTDKLSHGQDGKISLEWSLKCSAAQL